jgi:hypothetical protein
MQNYIDVIINKFIYPDPYSIIGIVLSVFGLYISLKQIKKAVKEADKRLNNALNEFKETIYYYLNEKNDLLTVNSITSDIIALEKKYGCPMITYTLILEIFREIKLTLGKDKKEKKIITKIKLLDGLLKDLEYVNIHRRGALLSIARTDRLFAYHKSQVIFSSGLFFIFLLIYIFINSIIILYIIFPVIFILQGYFIISNRRAELYWKNKQNSIISKKLPIIDLFYNMVRSRELSANIFWDNIIGPWWETPYTFSTNQFLDRHQYRLSIATQLEKKLKKIQKKLLLYNMIRPQKA